MAQKISVKSFVVDTMDDELGNALSDAIERGWELMFPPQFLYMGVPDRYNPAVVGKSPHFLIIFKKLVDTAPLLCKVCETSIETGELCEQCAVGNDPYKSADNCGNDLRR